MDKLRSASDGAGRRSNLRILLLCAALGACRAAPGAEAAAPAEAETLQTNLVHLGLQQLLDVSIVSVARKPQRIMETPAAVFIITADDIRRSGATTIPDALRMVPGFNVGHFNTSTWGVSARGFFTQGNKLLVLLDGRTVYNPMYATVQWDLPDVLLEDIERIEIIRGPGASVWGANAMNGVVNIITKHARDTQGTLLSGGGGTEERAFGSARVGGRAGSNAFYRIWVKGFDRDAVADTGEGVIPEPPSEDWRGGRTGMRMDWESGRDSAMLSGELYLSTYDAGVFRYSLTPPYAESEMDRIDGTGGFLLGRARRRLSATDDIELQAYYDRIDRQGPFLNYYMDTLDFDARHRFAWGRRQDIVYGAGCRQMDYHYHDGFEYTLEPNDRSPYILSAFAQDQIGLVPDRLALVLGSKVEEYDVSGTEWQPTARLLFTPTTAQTYWAAVSHAARAPSFAEQDGRLYANVTPPATGSDVPTLSYLLGNRDFESEEVLAYEAGYRVGASRRLFIDLAGFFNEYDDLRTIEGGVPFSSDTPVPHTERPSSIDNRLHGTSWGGEASLDWRPRDDWRLAATYSYMDARTSLESGSRDVRSRMTTWGTPRNQVSLRSAYDLTRNLEWDVWFRFVDDIPVTGVDEYLTADARLAWRPRKGLELAVVGQNLLQDQHSEYEAAYAVERSVYGKVTLLF